jgi:hypothetical protein
MSKISLVSSPITSRMLRASSRSRLGFNPKAVAGVSPPSPIGSPRYETRKTLSAFHPDPLSPDGWRPSPTRLRNLGKRRQAVRRNVIFRILAAVIGLFVLTGIATSQDLYGSICGIVTHQTGAAVPGVTLTATNTATNVSQHVTSKDDGSYSFLQLAIGDYYVRAAKTGFQTFTATRIHLDVNTVFNQDMHLTVGAVTRKLRCKLMLCRWRPRRLSWARQPISDSNQRRTSVRCDLRERYSQPEGGNHLPTNFPDRE